MTHSPDFNSVLAFHFSLMCSLNGLMVIATLYFDAEMSTDHCKKHYDENNNKHRPKGRFYSFLLWFWKSLEINMMQTGAMSSYYRPCHVKRTLQSKPKPNFICKHTVTQQNYYLAINVHQIVFTSNQLELVTIQLFRKRLAVPVVISGIFLLTWRKMCFTTKWVWQDSFFHSFC